MGNRHGAEKSSSKEDKDEKRKKKKKAKKKTKKRTAPGSDVDLDPDSSQFSRADSESMVFHSAENLSPYLDASTRSEEGAACVDFYDQGHIFSSRDFHDGFSIEACLPADLAASGLASGLTADVITADDVASMASGGYSTPLLSSPDVRRGIPRSPMAQRHKDSFLEPVPPIPSDFSSNTLSSASYQDGLSTPGTGRSSSRASSSTVDTNAAHCIERLEELERNIERTIIEKFAAKDESASNETSTPLLSRKKDFGAWERTREGSITPRGVGSAGQPCQSAENSPAMVRKISEPCRPVYKEGSVTPKGLIHGVWSQSAENSPVIVRKALPNPESPVILRRTPSQSPSVERKFPVNAPGSPMLFMRGGESQESPRLSPNIPRRAPIAAQEMSPNTPRRAPTVAREMSPNTPRRAPTVAQEMSPNTPRRAPMAAQEMSPNTPRRAPIAAQEMSPQFVRKLSSASEVPSSRVVQSISSSIAQSSSCSVAQKAKVPPPVPPKPPKTLTSPEIARRLQNMPKSPIMPRKVYAFQEAQANDPRSPFSDRDDPFSRNWRDGQMPPRSPSRSPEVRHRVARKTPSSSPSPKSLGRKLMPLEDRAPPPVPFPPSAPTQIQFCQQEKGTPVKRCVVATQPSTAVVLAEGPSQENLSGPHAQCQSTEGWSSAHHKAAPGKTVSGFESQDSDKAGKGAVSEDAIKESSESALFGSVSPKLKRQQKACGGDGSDVHRADSFSSSSGTCSTPCSPRLAASHRRHRAGRHAPYESSDLSSEGALDSCGEQSPRRRRAVWRKDDSKEDAGTLSIDIAGGLTYHNHPADEAMTEAAGCLPPQDVMSANTCHPEFAATSRDPGRRQGKTTATPGTKLAGGLTELSACHPHYVPDTYDPHTAVGLHLTAEYTQHADRTGSAVIADSTVARNAAARREGEGEGRSVREDANFSDSGEERVRAKQGRGRERVPGGERVHASRAAPVSGPVGSAPDYGSQCGTAGCSSSSNSSSVVVGSSHCVGSSAHVAVNSRTLGQKIRDAINQSSSFREVFTAELSSSSADKDDGTSYTSDDSVFTTPTPTPVHPHSQRQRDPPTDGLSGGVVTAGHRHPLSLPPHGDRTARRHHLPPDAGDGTGDGGEGGQRGLSPWLTDSDGRPFRAPVSVALDTTAIRRIDMDVNVTLPHSQWEPEPPSGASTAVTTAATISPPAHSTSTAAPPPATTGAATTCSPSQLPSSAGQSGDGPSRSQPDARAGGQCSEPGRPTWPESAHCGGHSEKQHAHPDITDRQLVPGPGRGAEHSATDTNSQVTEEGGGGGKQKAEGECDDGGNKGDKQCADRIIVDGAVSSSPSFSSPSSCAHHLPLTDLNPKGERGEGGEGERMEGAVQAAELNSPRSSGSGPAIVTGLWQQAGEKAGSANTAPCVHPLSARPATHGTTCDSFSPSPTLPVSQQRKTQSSTTPTTTTSTTTTTTHSQNVKVSNSAVTESQQDEHHDENVPPPSPTAMNTLAEEEEEEEEDVEGLVNAHQDSDISSRISQEMQLFGETVVKRLSSLLESQASESDSCLEESRTDLPGKLSKNVEPALLGVDCSGHAAPVFQLPLNAASEEGGSRHMCLESGASVTNTETEDGIKTAGVPGDAERRSAEDEVEPVLHEELNTLATEDLPGERLVTSDTTETLSTDQELSASSKRESTTSTATDETLTSFKTRSTTDSAEFDDNTFILPESLVFVRSVDEGDAKSEDGDDVNSGSEGGRFVKRPSIPAELTRHGSPSETTPHKPRKKRRRQVGSYDVSARSDVTEPQPKRGSKQIRDVIDAYCDEDEVSETSDVSSRPDSDLMHRSSYSRSQHQPPVSHPQAQDNALHVVRKPKPPADRSTDSSDECSPQGDSGKRQRQSGSSHDFSFKIPEIEEMFGELMGVKTLLEDLADKTPTAESQPLLPKPSVSGGAPGGDQGRWKELLGPGQQVRRRSKTSPAKTDRTESDLDVSEHRDDASTDSMYADDEDEGSELVFQRSYSEKDGAEVVLSCTIYNSGHDKDGDSDEFWADAEEAVAAEEKFKVIESAADAAGSAFHNARIQMHDIHQHLQDLRRQMELLQDDITSTSLTLTPEYSLESEHRPVTE